MAARIAQMEREGPVQQQAQLMAAATLPHGSILCQPDQHGEGGGRFVTSPLSLSVLLCLNNLPTLMLTLIGVTTSILDRAVPPLPSLLMQTWRQPRTFH